MAANRITTMMITARKSFSVASAGELKKVKKEYREADIKKQVMIRKPKRKLSCNLVNLDIFIKLMTLVTY